MASSANSASTGKTHARAAARTGGTTRARKTLFGTVCVCVVGLAAFLGSGAPSAGAATSPGGDRAYELVSPSDKNGGDITPDSRRTRAASDGNAVGFISLAAFGDVIGTGVAVDYVSVRTPAPSVGQNGWSTHAVTPRQDAGTFAGLLGALEPLYVGEYSEELDKGVFLALSPVLSDPYVGDVLNLYVRDDLRQAGTGSYRLVTGCPLCSETGTPLPPLPATSGGANQLRPMLAGMSGNTSHIVFESKQRLTADATMAGNVQTYEWNGQTVKLVGRIPSPGELECSDVSGPDCVPLDVSIAGQGAGASHSPSRTPNVISSGSDGHVRVFFTRPTNLFGTGSSAGGFDGHIYMRIDSERTVHVNASERTVATKFSRARFLDASADGTRAFFTTSQALTDDAPTAGIKLYMYDALKSPAAPDNLTLLSKDEQLEDGGVAQGVIGLSEDGQYVYFIANGQLVSGQPALGGAPGIYLWHNGTRTFIGQAPIGTAQNELLSSGPNYLLTPRQARVTPDGKTLLFTSIDGAGLLGYDHGACTGTGLGTGCRELYVYRANTNTLACASCDPARAPATGMATTVIRTFNGGTQTSWHETRALTDDGSTVFFNTPEALVLEDTNGRIDAYEYSVKTGEVRLVSSGGAFSDSWFMDASGSGRDAFFITRERLTAWDRDSAYDLYDARVGGGFPEPVAGTAPCVGEACQGVPSSSPAVAAAGSAALKSEGNAKQRRDRARKRCGRGKRKVTRKGKAHCVKKKTKRKNSRKHKRANTNRRAGR